VPQQPATPSSSSFDDDLQAARSDFEKDVADARQHVDAGTPVPHPIVAKLLDWLPAAGGLAGGIAGGIGGTVFGMGVGGWPGAVGGAALGGGAGEAGKELINRAIGNPAPATSIDAAKAVGIEAGKQGLAEAGGQGTMGVLKTFAPSFMRSALNPGIKVLQKTGELETAAETPRMVTAALEAGGDVTPSGVRTLAGARDAATAVKDAIVVNLGGKVSPGNVAAVAQGYADGLLINADKKFAQQVIDDFSAQYVRDPATGRLRQWLAPKLADVLKTQYRQGVPFGEEARSAIEARKAIGRGLKEGLEALDTTKTLSAANAKVADLIDATAAAARANALWKNKSLAMRTLSAISGRSPALNSMIARGLYTSAEKIAHVPAGTLMALGAVLGGATDAPQATTAKQGTDQPQVDPIGIR
jgi:hypothetical protein